MKSKLKRHLRINEIQTRMKVRKKGQKQRERRLNSRNQNGQFPCTQAAMGRPFPSFSMHNKLHGKTGANTQAAMRRSFPTQHNLRR